MIRHRALCAALLLLSGPVWSQNAPEMRVRELRAHLGQQVTVKGRTGGIVEKLEQPGQRVYSLRDDYQDLVFVRAGGREYPVFGVTYRVSGRPVVDEGNRLCLEESGRRRVYPLGGAPTWLVGALVGLPLLALAVAAYVGWRQRRQPAPPGPLPTPWGWALVVAGPDERKRFALRGQRVLVGRDQDPASAVALTDPLVSGEHGLIERDGGRIYYTDTRSTNGSWVDEQPAPAGQRVELDLGREALLRLGPTTTVRLTPHGREITRRAGEVDEALQRPTEREG